MASTKFNQIPSELKRHGIEPTQEAIDAITDILQNDNRVSVSSAVKRYVQQFKANSTTETTDTPPQGEFKSGSSSIKQVFKKQLKTQIVVESLKEIVEELKAGDFSDIDLNFEVENLSFEGVDFFGQSDKLLPASVPASEVISEVEVEAIAVQ